MSKENATNQTNPAIKRITIGPSRIGGQKMPADLPDEYGKYITGLEKAYDKLSVKNKAPIEAVEASSALRKFARQVIKEQCWGCEMDGFEIQDLAEKLELIAKHTATEDDVEDGDDYEVGDVIYKFTDFLKGNE